MKTGYAKEYPQRKVDHNGKKQVRLNIEEVQIEGDTQYRYNYIEIDPPVTREKVLAAVQQEIDEADLPIIEAESALVDSSSADWAQAVEDMAAMIADMSYADVAQIVENLFGNLTAGQKTYLKRVGQAVIYLLKK